MKTNTEIVKGVMWSSRFGALAEIFVVTAIEKYAEACAKADPATFESPLMNGAAWVGVAKEIKEKMDAAYARNAKGGT